MILGNLRLGDGQQIYLIGQVIARDFIPHIRLVDYMDDHADTQYLQHQGTKSLVRRHHPDLVRWLDQHHARVTFWVDPVVLMDSKNPFPVSYGLGFVPGQEHLETLFLLRWS